MTAHRNPVAAALTAAAMSQYHRLACDLCGEDHVELRAVDLCGWVPDQITCAACYHHPEADFTDLPLAQGAEA